MILLRFFVMLKVYIMVNSARHAKMRRRWRQPDGRGGSIMAAGSADAVKKLLLMSRRCGLELGLQCGLELGLHSKLLCSISP